MAKATISGIRAKLARADVHLQTLDREISGFLAENPYEFVGDFDSEREEFVAKARFKTYPLWNDWATIIGDCVHNLRSALDHLAWQLVLLNNGTPGRETSFPILEDRLSQKGHMRRCRIETDSGRVRPSVEACVERAQPYHRTDDPTLHPLAILGGLSNEDKHRTLTVTSAALEDFGIGISVMRDVDMGISVHGFRGPFDENTELARWWLRVTGPNPQVQMHPYGTIDIAFGKEGPGAGKLVRDTLRDIRSYVSNLSDILIAKAI